METSSEDKTRSPKDANLTDCSRTRADLGRAKKANAGTPRAPRKPLLRTEQEREQGNSSTSLVPHKLSQEPKCGQERSGGSAPPSPRQPSGEPEYERECGDGSTALFLFERSDGPEHEGNHDIAEDGGAYDYNNLVDAMDVPHMMANLRATAQAGFDVLGKEFHYLAQQCQKSKLHRQEMIRASQDSFDAMLEDCTARERCCLELQQVNVKFKDAQVHALQDIRFLRECLGTATEMLEKHRSKRMSKLMNKTNE